MKTVSSVLILRSLAGLALLLGGAGAMGVEEVAYKVEKTDGDFEVRQYAPQVVAETLVGGSLEDAGNTAFGMLYDYISGSNRSKVEVAAAAPAAQKPEGQKIAMTAPVGQEAVSSNRWSVTFAMPAGSALDTLPEPADPSVRLRAIPPRRMAAVCYSGTWSQAGYEQQLTRLREWMKANNLTAAGAPVWARYDPPFMPWFLRRNEILVPMAPDK